uniref:Uncharacterized protein n=1 Tax=Arundo donax TaxID=35708 RepID=A0A0A8YIW2_ARUDO
MSSSGYYSIQVQFITVRVGALVFAVLHGKILKWIPQFWIDSTVTFCHFHG